MQSTDVEKFTFFWRHRLGQWSRCKFTLRGAEYNCCEQAMMALKAIHFNDIYTLQKIMDTKDPKEQKALGRLVRNFNEESWNEVCKLYVYDANFARFSQNEDDRKILFATKGTTLVEASPYDRIWGIGLSESDPRALKRETWLGKNYLGEVLTKVRDDLLLKYENNEKSE